MTSRSIRLSALSLIVLAIAGPAAAPVAGQVRLPKFGPGKLPRFPGLPEFDPAGPGRTPAFDPQIMFDQFFGRGGPGDFDDEALAKVEVSFDEEARLGKQSLEAARQQLDARRIQLVTRGKEVEYLARLVELVRPQMTEAKRYRKLHVYWMETGQPEAYSLPGGHLLFSRGLVDAAQCEAALIAVVGHELAHLDRGHLLRRTKQWKLAQKSLAEPNKDPSPEKMFQSMSLMLQLFQRPFGPDEELEADRDGIAWAYRLGYDPRAVRLIYDALEAHGKNGPDFLPAFLRTHPQSAERQENLHRTFADLQTVELKSRLYIGRENLHRLLTRKQKEFPE